MKNPWNRYHGQVGLIEWLRLRLPKLLYSLCLALSHTHTHHSLPSQALRWQVLDISSEAMESISNIGHHSDTTVWLYEAIAASHYTLRVLLLLSTLDISTLWTVHRVPIRVRFVSEFMMMRRRLEHDHRRRGSTCGHVTIVVCSVVTSRS